VSETSYGLRLPRPTWLTSGAIRLGILTAFIVGIGMLPGTPTRERFIDFQRRGDDDHDESTAARSLSPRPDRHTST
jgi:hypothetical protein